MSNFLIRATRNSGENAALLKEVKSLLGRSFSKSTTKAATSWLLFDTKEPLLKISVVSQDDLCVDLAFEIRPGVIRRAGDQLDDPKLISLKRMYSLTGKSGVRFNQDVEPDVVFTDYNGVLEFTKMLISRLS